MRLVPEGPKRLGPGSGARSVVTRDHDEDDRTAAISMRCGRSAAGARPHRPRAKQARTPSGPPACFRHAAFGWRPRRSRRRTGDRCRGPAQAGRGRDRTSGAPSTPPLAADRASPAGRGWRRRGRSSRPSRAGRGPPNLRPRVGRPRRDPAPSRWRDRSRRRRNRSQGRSDAWLNGANACPQAGQRSSRRLPWRAQAIVVARRHCLRKYGCSSSARHCGQNCSQAACRRPRRPGERSARNGARSARAPIPARVMPPTASGVRPVQRTSRSRTIAGSARSSRPDQAPELKIERGSERPGRQAVAEGQPMQPAREQFVGLRSRDDRPMARQEVVGHGVGLRWRAIPDPSTSSQQRVALRRAAPARKRDMRERLDRGRS